MNIPILMTKLNKPEIPYLVISRESRLKDSDWANMILVSAQAGSGKSTIVSAWLSEQSKAYCWYSLDDWDNNLIQFFTYLIAGIKPIDLQVSQELKHLLAAFQSIGFEAFLKALINQLHAIKSPYILIFDDYHLIRNQLIHEVIKTILDHFPPFMQLVLITREDPPFPLAKMRADKKLLEIRISQLRFTEEEVKKYFLKQLNISLEEKHIRLIYLSIEGWIAGLQMLALSMQGIDDITGFIHSFSKNQHYVMDYLMEEVLERQPLEIKEFLLRTSILDFFSKDLCDAVLQLETGSSNHIIEKLMKTNCFIVSTDLTHKWFRYHHLFRDVLRQRLSQESKQEMEALHGLAGIWYKSNGFTQESIHHFLEANDFEEAAKIIECKWSEMDIQLQSASWLDMVKKLPPIILEKSPVLTMGYGWALLDLGDTEASLEWFKKSQELYNVYQTDGNLENIIINDRTQFDLLPATIASAYGYIAAATGDVEGVFTHSHNALNLIPDNQYFKRAVVEMLLGIAHWSKGNLKEAESIIIRSFKNIKKARNPIFENSYYMVLGELYIHQDKLNKGKAMFEQTISRLKKDNLVTILLPSLYLALGKIAFLQNENTKAHSLLEESKKYGQRYALMDWEYKYYLLLARIYCSEKLYDLSLDCINESKRYYYLNPIPEDVSIDEVEKKIVLEVAHHQPSSVLDIGDKNMIAFKKEHINQSLSEPLTVRELEVLSLIVSGLSNKEICDKLFLALSTVKGYNQNIFGKLEVNSRTKAAAKAMELGLI
ncbi:MAG: hypothetical protein GX787_02000 [Tissierellia bacterium]|jgi:LuxR family maltose regulon positive regulatory protein|nr:hypothetical protein [Tissierellia bacterium]